jgi:hypothetical protein
MSVDQPMKRNFKKYDRYDIKNMICADFSRRPEFVKVSILKIYYYNITIVDNKLHEILCNEISDSLTIGLLRSIKDVLLKSNGSN